MCYDGYEVLADDNIRPELRSHSQIEIAGTLAEQMFAESASPESAATRKKISTRTLGVMGRSPLLELPYFDIATMTIPDMMHIVPGVVGAHFFSTIFGNKLSAKLRTLQAKEREVQTRQEEEEVAFFEREEKEFPARHAKWKLDVKICQAKADKAKTGETRNKYLDKMPKEPQMPVFDARSRAAAVSDIWRSWRSLARRSEFLCC